MSQFVLDASIILTWCFPDEESQKALEISERIAAGERVAVPAFWRHEILNALLVGERRKRITPELTQAFLDDLDRLPVDVDPPSRRGRRLQDDAGAVPQASPDRL